MKIAVIGAMENEVSGLKEKMNDISVRTISNIQFVSGKISGIEVIVAKAGVGKVNAAICAQTIILKYRPDTIINIGVAGGYHTLNIGEVVIADHVVQHDMDTTSCGDPRAYISGIGIVQIPADKSLSDDLMKTAKSFGASCHSGVIVSGDQFINSSERAKRLNEEFDAIAYEMEGAAIGHVCYQNKIPFAVLRTISDNGDDSSNVDFSEFVEKSAKVSISIILKYLEQLKRSNW